MQEEEIRRALEFCMTGEEKFRLNGEELGFNMVDYWSFCYSNVFDEHGAIAEFVVAKALGLERPTNKKQWTLYDIRYRNKRVEVKVTAYYHSFNDELEISQARVFGIPRKEGKEYLNDELVVGDFVRQNDVYVFCLIKGMTLEDSYPLNLNNWEFYVVPTSTINELAREQKTISLGRVREIAAPITYDQIKGAVDDIIDDL